MPSLRINNLYALFFRNFFRLNVVYKIGTLVCLGELSVKEVEIQKIRHGLIERVIAFYSLLEDHLDILKTADVNQSSAISSLEEKIRETREWLEKAQLNEISDELSVKQREQFDKLSKEFSKILQEHR